MNLEDLYSIKCQENSDINEHLPLLKVYGEKCKHITEFGMRNGNSTIAFLTAKPDKLISYDTNINCYKTFEFLKNFLAPNTTLRFANENDLLIEIEETDMLFIDTYHVYEQLRAELFIHANKVRKYIAIHDTMLYGEKGERISANDALEKGGELQAINEFLKVNKEWKIVEDKKNNNGLMILERI